MYKVINTFNNHITNHRTERGAVKAYESQCAALGTFAHYVKVESSEGRLYCIGGDLFTEDQYMESDECLQD